MMADDHSTCRGALWTHTHTHTQIQLEVEYAAVVRFSADIGHEAQAAGYFLRLTGISALIVRLLMDWSGMT